MEKVYKNFEKVKTVLPYGAIKAIAERANVSPLTVSNVLNGSSYNLKATQEISRYLDELIEQKENIENAVEALIN
jgi:DNA-binding LacI/PurR family transcriptional regulator